MRIRIKDELTPLVLLTGLLITVIILFPGNTTCVVLGVPFVIFSPGYTLVAAIYPRMTRLSGIERAALSFGMSLAVVPMMGLILSLTPWGIAAESIVGSTASFILVMAAIAWFRRPSLPEAERFSIDFTVSPAILGNTTKLRLLSVILILAVLGTAGTVGYTLTSPHPGQSFTEFYILGCGGTATDYPKELRLGQGGRVVTGIVNHEHETTTYRLEVSIDGLRDNEVGPIVLEHDETWETEVSFVPQVAGERQNVEFVLYRNGGIKPYMEALRLWIDVREG